MTIIVLVDVKFLEANGFLHFFVSPNYCRRRFRPLTPPPLSCSGPLCRFGSSGKNCPVSPSLTLATSSGGATGDDHAAAVQRASIEIHGLDAILTDLHQPAAAAQAANLIPDRCNDCVISSHREVSSTDVNDMNATAVSHDSMREIGIFRHDG